MSSENIRRAAELMEQAHTLLARGPLAYYLTEMAAAHDLLMSRFSPLKVGDRVTLAKVPDYETAPGWQHCAHFLVVGATGVVKAAECGSRGFRFGVEFDDDSWIDNTGHERAKGTVVFREPDNRMLFYFGEEWLNVLPDA